jgi:cyclopropane-fatty-acyl-phospholipid synthase
MLYKFKSQSEAEIIMLQPDGDQMLALVGREPTPQGIITVEQIPAAVSALETAIEAHEHAQANHPENLPMESGLPEGNVPLRHRAAPFIDLLKRSAAAGKDVVWGF